MTKGFTSEYAWKERTCSEKQPWPGRRQPKERESIGDAISKIGKVPVLGLIAGVSVATDQASGVGEDLSSRIGNTGSNNPKRWGLLPPILQDPPLQFHDYLPAAELQLLFPLLKVKLKISTRAITVP